jgi:hypothetical protein
MIAQFVAEVLEMLLSQPAFDVTRAIHARRRVALVVDEVAGLPVVGAVEEMVLSHFDQSGKRSVRRDVPPMASSYLFARTTIASAFHRT